MFIVSRKRTFKENYKETLFYRTMNTLLFFTTMEIHDLPSVSPSGISQPFSINS